MSFAYFIATLKAQWRSVVIAISAVIALAVAFSALLPSRYTAIATVMLDVTSQDGIASVSLPAEALPQYQRTQYDIVRSDRVLMAAAIASGLDRRAEFLANWRAETGGEGDYHAWLVDTLRKHLDVLPHGPSTAMDITYTSPDPDLAAKMTNAIMAAFIDMTQSMRVDAAQQELNFFEQRSKQKRALLESAQRRLSEFEREHKLPTSDPTLDVEAARVLYLASASREAQSRLTDASTRRGLAGTDPAVMPEFQHNAVLDSLNLDLSALQVDLSRASVSLGPGHPDVVAMRKKLADLQERRKAELAKVAGSLGVNDKVATRSASQARLQLLAQRNTVLSDKPEQQQVDLMRHDIQVALANYMDSLARADASTGRSLAHTTNVVILREASLPTLATFPRIPLNVILAIIFGSLIGAGIAIERELDSPLLRAGVTGALPIMMALPMHRAPRRRFFRNAFNRIKNWLQRSRGTHAGA